MVQPGIWDICSATGFGVTLGEALILSVCQLPGSNLGDSHIHSSHGIVGKKSTLKIVR